MEKNAKLHICQTPYIHLGTQIIRGKIVYTFLDDFVLGNPFDVRT